MPTAEQQKQYTLLSGRLQEISHRYSSELPNGATSLRLNVTDRKVVVEVYDNQGKQIGIVPNDKTSRNFRTMLEASFLRETLPDLDGIVAIL